ncbi:hypothetical protein PVAP13_5NG101600 [Panicum virgatum]|uniref:FAS1 domain-containing protein n=1 Tax=Panicum virgatum TaxID=38727 RepID=A0A8T0RNL6_PANVG|nr:hypothetical protein PVAP13_5NG101600 [Panicum virgatum]
MALRSVFLLAVFLLPLAATATASASAPNSASTCTATDLGNSPPLDMAGPQSSSSAGEMTEEEARLLAQLEGLMREGTAAQDLAQRVEHVRSILELLGFREMAAAAPYLVASPVLASWPGPLTVFAVPDEVLESSCPGCPRVESLVEHIALGAFPYAELSSKPMRKVATAMLGFCFTSASSSAGGASDDIISVNNVRIARPNLYNNGRLVVHGMEGRVVVPPRGSCYNAERVDDLLSRVDVLNLVIRMLANAA